MLVLAFLLVITDLVIITINKLNFIPIAICFQLIVIAKADYSLGMEVPLIAFVLLIKAVVIPFLLYDIIKKIKTSAHDHSIVHWGLIAVFMIGALLGAYLFMHEVGAGPLTAAAIVTALTGILLIISRQTIISQLAGFILLQNGIFAFSSSFLSKTTFAMELLPALDVLGTVIIMIYAIQLIYKSSGSIDIKTFSTLRG